MLRIFEKLVGPMSWVADKIFLAAVIFAVFTDPLGLLRPLISLFTF